MDADQKRVHEYFCCLLYSKILYHLTDNAQRLVDCDVGLRLNPMHFTSQQLQEAIDSMLNDKPRLQRIKRISQRIAKTENVKNACDILEKVAQQKTASKNGFPEQFNQ